MGAKGAGAAGPWARQGLTGSDVALDQGDLGPQPGRVGGGLVPGRTAPEDHHTQEVHRAEDLNRVVDLLS